MANFSFCNYHICYNYSKSFIHQIYKKNLENEARNTDELLYNSLAKVQAEA